MHADTGVEDDAVLIRQRIRWWRLERNLSQQIVADRTGISRAYLTHIEQGTRRLDNRSTIEAIARALGVSYADLTGQPMRPDTPELQQAHAAIQEIRVTWLTSSLSDGADVRPRPLQQIAGEVDAAAEAWQECAYAAASRSLPLVLAELHALVAGGAHAALPYAVQALDTGAWTARVLGHYDLAHALAVRETEAAQMADDAALAGLAAFTHTLMILAMGTGHHGVNAAARQHAQRAIDQLRPRASDREQLEVLGMLHLAAARADVADADELLVEGDRIAARTGDGDVFRLYFGPTNINIWRLQLAMEQREGGRALEISKRVRPEAIGSRSRRTMYYRHFGLALAQERGHEQQAVQALLRAERHAPGKLRLDPLARETVGHMLSRARATAGGNDLLRLARHVGIL